MPVMGHSYAEEDGKPQRVVPGGRQPRPGRGRGAQGRHPLAGRAGDPRRRPSSTSPSFAARYDELVVGARDNKLQPDAYQGANITLTNPGGIGTVASVPRLMPGQGTIVATGAIGYPPGLDAGRPEQLRELGVEKVMTMTSTYDHRVIQGAESGSFLRRIDELLQGEDGFYDDGLRARSALDRRACEGDAGRTAVTAAEPVPAAAHPGRQRQCPTPRCSRPCRPPPRVVKAHRMHGHLAARLDPLGSRARRRPGARPGDAWTSPPS